MLKAVIFDMDGVLVDSEPLHKRASDETLARYGAALPPDYGRNFIGSTILHMFQVMAADLGLTATAEELTEVYGEILEELVRREGYEPIPGTKQFIEDLRRNGCLLAVASSSTPREIEENTEACGIRALFDELVSGTLYPHPKPAPDVFLGAAGRLGVEPCECLVVEDAMNGVAAAKAAGMACIGFRNPNSGNQDLSQADLLLLGFEEADYRLALRTWSHAFGEPMEIAEGSRVLLRELSDEDIPVLYAIYQEPQVKRFVREMQGSPADAADWFRAYRDGAYRFYGCGIWGIFRREDGRLIGSCGLERKAGGMELGYVVSGEFTGQGYAAEAAGLALGYGFQELGCAAISAIIDEENTRSIQVAERIGMTLQGHLVREGRNCVRYGKCHTK